MAWRFGCEHGGCWHGGAGGEGTIGDCDGLLGSSSVGGSRLWSWYHDGSAGWADSGEALNDCGAVDNAS